MRKVLMGLFLMAAATVTTADAQAPVALPGGSFMLFPRTDAMYDTDKSFILVQSQDNGAMTLRWFCTEGELQMILIDSNRRGDRDREVGVRYRFDTEPVSPLGYWSMTPRGGASAPLWRR
jgi:hypothetical protein